jgi:hypothetical protein
MIASKEWIAWLIVGLLSLLGMWAYGEHRFAQGAASRDPQIQALNTQIASAAVALNSCNDAAKRNEQAAAAQRDMADAALDAATERDKGKTAELTEAVRKLKAAQATPDCKATAEARLCPALSQY